MAIIRVDGMPFCPECGKEVSDDAIFCDYCGSRIRKRSSFRRMEEHDYFGGVNAGVILIILAVFFIMHRGVFSDFIAWISGWGVSGPTMIPDSLIPPVIWFLSAVGGWSLIMAFIRIISGVNRRNAISDAFGAAFMLAASYLFQRYNSNLIPLKILLPSLVVTLGATIFLGSALYYILHDRLKSKA